MNERIHTLAEEAGLYIEVFNCGCNMFDVTMGDKHDLSLIHISEPTRPY